MRKIELTQGKYALVDDKDFEWLNQWKWHYTGCGYARRCDYSRGKPEKYIYLHRFLMGFSNKETDHINNNKLDNRRNNLRLVNRSQSMANTLLRKTNTSGFKGVHLDKTRKKWAVQITKNYKHIHLGRFTDIKQAAFAYNQAAKKYFGEFARINIK